MKQCPLCGAILQSAKTGNIVPTCLSTWQEYNDLIDENAKLDNLKGNIALACGELNKLLSAQANQRNGGE
jgi:transcription initiation factor IIE alpha subunit